MPTDQSERFHDQPAGTKRKFSGTLRNVIFHAAGATFVLACTLLFIHASTRGTPWHTIGCFTYGCMMLLYCVVPAAYRILSRKLARAFLRVFDFPDICLLVAGTYTLCTLM